MLYQAVPSLSALERINAMQATSMAIALAFAKDGKRPDSVTADLRDADLEG